MDKKEKNWQPLILIVDDTAKNLQLLGSILKEEGYKISVANNGNQAISIASQALPDLILLDVMMPQLDGFQTCTKMKSLIKTKDIPIIFLTAKVEKDDIVKGFKTGAVDYITKPFNTVELKARVKTHLELKRSKEVLKQQNELLKKLSITDGLTGLYNHRYIMDDLSKSIEESKRYKQPLSIAMIDIDNFKKINDDFGHPFGDEVLIGLASTFENHIRNTDSIGRYGGEEFLMILNHADLSNAVKVLERIREAVENMRWQHESLKVTISIGTCQRDDEEVSELIKTADTLLYKAKKNGKNRIEH